MFHTVLQRFLDLSPLFSAVIVGGVITTVSMWPKWLWEWEQNHPIISKCIGLILGLIVIVGAISSYEQSKQMLTKSDLGPLVTKKEFQEQMDSIIIQQRRLKEIPTTHEIESIMSSDKKVVIQTGDVSFYINEQSVSSLVNIDFATSPVIIINVHNYSGRTLHAPVVGFAIGNCEAIGDPSWQKDVPREHISSLTFSTPSDERIPSIRHGDAGTNFPPISLTCDSAFEYYDGGIYLSANDLTRMSYTFKIFRKTSRQFHAI